MNAVVACAATTNTRKIEYTFLTVLHAQTMSGMISRLDYLRAKI
jgi:hypothetical protein